VRDGGSVLALVLTSAAIMGTPGPATISLTAAGAAFGIRRSLGYLAGIIAGTVVVLGAVATGITAVLLGVPGVRPVLMGLSAGYILWLAYHLATATPQSAQTQGVAAPSLAGGALLGLANPKAWVAITAVFASAQLARAASADAVAKAAVLTGMIVLINTAWLVAGASFAGLFRCPRRARTVNCVLAVVLVGASAFAIAG
jgi:threonine/homoserine/homoserine lactone efflux protein